MEAKQKKIDSLNQKIKEQKNKKKKLEQENRRLQKKQDEEKEKEIGKKVQEMILSNSFETPAAMETFIEKIKREMAEENTKGGYAMKIESNDKAIQKIVEQINKLEAKRNQERNKLSNQLRKNRDVAIFSMGGMVENIFKVDVHSLIEQEVDNYFKENNINPKASERNARIRKVFGDLARSEIEKLLEYKRKYNQLSNKI